MLPIKNFLKQEDSLSPLLFKFALEYAFGKIQANQDGLKLNGAHQFLVNVKIFNILGGNLHKHSENYIMRLILF